MFVPIDLGLIGYADAFALQRRLVDARAADAIPDVLLLLEHPPTITHSHTGRGADHLLAPPGLLAARGVVVEPTDRGGDITFHGPGQLVGYPIVALRDGERDLHRWLRTLEDVLIEVAAHFDVPAVRVPRRTGIWTMDEARKLGAIGVKVSRWVASHGFALNVTTNLSFFDLIVPCGIRDAGVTSLLAETGASPSMWAVKERAITAFAEATGRGRVAIPDPLRILLPPAAIAAGSSSEKDPWPSISG